MNLKFKYAAKGTKFQADEMYVMTRTLKHFQLIASGEVPDGTCISTNSTQVLSFSFFKIGTGSSEKCCIFAKKLNVFILLNAVFMFINTMFMFLNTV